MKGSVFVYVKSFPEIGSKKYLVESSFDNSDHVNERFLADEISVNNNGIEVLAGWLGSFNGYGSYARGLVTVTKVIPAFDGITNEIYGSTIEYI